MINQLFTHFAAACNPSGGSFFGFQKWYQYLDGVKDTTGKCVPSVEHLSDIWLIVAAIIEILIRVAAIGAVVMIIYGGFTYVSSQGEPDATKKAKDTITNALIGLVVAIMAAAFVSFIAGSVS